jgi:hypothetical protein
MESESTLSYSNEQICDMYYALYQKMPNKLHFCRLPHPWFVEEDPRMVDCFKRWMSDNIHTNGVQIEYHRRMQESPENAKEHYRWYADKLGLDISEIKEYHSIPDKTPAEDEGMCQ